LATCRERLADFKVPAKVVIRDQLPTSRIGKVERKALEEMAKQLLETDDN
jgi:fatty-acyl-CoA synthase